MVTIAFRVPEDVKAFLRNSPDWRDEFIRDVREKMTK